MASCAPAPPEPLNLTEADIARCQAEASRPVVMVGPLGTAIRELPPDSAHEACLRAASARNNAEARFANPPQKPGGYTPLGLPPLRR